MQFKFLVIPVLCSLVALSGCNSTKKALGLKRNQPNEFTTMERAPLSVPPDFSLRPPMPGAERPQEAKEGSASEKAEALLLGPEAQKKSGDSNAPFLEKAGSAERDPQVRQKIRADEQQAQQKADESWTSKMWSKKKEAIVDPVAESKRLKEEEAKAKAST